ncbi:hypothetical protein GCM10029992_23420 [Glycomyces albus]
MISRVIDEIVAAGSAEPLRTWAVPLIATALASSWVFAIGYRCLFAAQTLTRVGTVRRLTDQLNTAGTGVRGRVSPARWSIYPQRIRSRPGCSCSSSASDGWAWSCSPSARS